SPCRKAPGVSVGRRSSARHRACRIFANTTNFAPETACGWKADRCCCCGASIDEHRPRLRDHRADHRNWIAYDTLSPHSPYQWTNSRLVPPKNEFAQKKAVSERARQAALASSIDVAAAAGWT